MQPPTGTGEEEQAKALAEVLRAQAEMEARERQMAKARAEAESAQRSAREAAEAPSAAKEMLARRRLQASCQRELAEVYGIELKMKGMDPNREDRVRSLPGATSSNPAKGGDQATTFDPSMTPVQALAYHRGAVSGLLKRTGVANPELAFGFNGLAGALRQTGNYPEAENCYRLALQVIELAIRDGHAPSGLQQFPLELDEKGFDREEAAREFVTVAPELKTSRRVEERELPPDPDILSKCKVAEAAVRNNLGVLLRVWGRYEEADKEYETSWRIVKEKLGEGSFEAAVLRNNIGLLYDVTGRMVDAETTYSKALAILREGGGSQAARLAAVTNNLAGLYLEKGKTEPAQRLLLESIRLIEEQHGPVSATVGLRHYNLGWVYHLQGKEPEAEQELQQALAIATLVQQPALTWAVQSAYAKVLLAQGKPGPATLLAKSAVNRIQAMRQDMAGSGVKHAGVFRTTVEGVYRQLAALLVAQGRLPEAEHVMELLKDQEFSQFARRSAESAGLAAGRVTLTGYENDRHQELERAAAPLGALSARRSALKEKTPRSPDEEAEYLRLGKEIDQAAKAFNATLVRVCASFGAERRREKEEVREAVGIQADLAELGAGAVAVYTIVDQEELTLLLIAPKYRRAFTRKVGSAQLADKIFAFRRLLQPDAAGVLRDPVPAARELYDLVFRPLAPELEAAGAQTILWHLDGPLRYLPLSALHDGSDFVVARYRNVLYTSASKARLKDRPAGTWRVLGLGLSQPRTVLGRSYSPLPGVPEELKGIVRSASAPGGVIPGDAYLDDAFTWELLRGRLEDAGSYPLVHIASHFHFETGDDSSSYLVLGNGTPLTLREVEDQVNLFAGVDLLTLSACETAVGGGKDQDGREVDGLSILAQRQGAKAVVATLWPVADPSTSTLMQRFYRLREEKRLSKAEALREAQLELLRGANSPGAGEGERGAVNLARVAARPSAKAEPVDPGRPYAHPYYWAPFILMGNWQ
ncbi:CHAT domain-containing protein [Geomonas paludis]|uniref:CHAT domain-containing protein n=1 Tax=Geomonas paludis TaxID=2740185 RepID=A0A6V8MU73_9BACT|nr:CHAT domain-containing protein [Geomonas paludis]UPU38201.1 CHAT domain-containing protein [Geomonas paludis]GFO63267.1 hypothetical protein GMPD_11860 [Geomonas paludis]